MIEKTFVVMAEDGIHVRPADTIVKASSKFKSDIVFIKDGMDYNAKSILNIMTMAVDKGESLTIRAEGEDEETAVESIIDLINNGLD